MRALAAIAVIAALARGPASGEIPPAPTRWVTDGADLLSAETRATLDRRLEEFERRTGHQVLVWIGRRLEGRSLEEFAVRAFEAWGVGRRGRDDGVVVFLFAEDRRVRIEVGYGLEDRLPDLVASRIIREEMVPRLARGDPDGAVGAAVERVLAVVSGDAAAGRGPPAGRQPVIVPLVAFAIFALVVLFLFFTNPALAVYLLFTLGPGRRGPRWGGGGFGGGLGGGGFSGGGGRSGGGGASGSW